MAISDYFKPVVTMTADEVRKFLKGKKADEYNLIDVRLPVEYEVDHIPGARLIPVGDIDRHVHELDPEKPTIAY
jgi:rhodanese-related sulfurtransferase